MDDIALDFSSVHLAWAECSEIVQIYEMSMD